VAPRIERGAKVKDLPRSVAPPSYSHEDVLKIVNTACSSPKGPYAHWSMKRIAEASGTGMKESRIHEILKVLDIKPHQYRMWLSPIEKDPSSKGRRQRYADCTQAQGDSSGSRWAPASGEGSEGVHQGPAA
jgi:hypothetical protein